MSEDMRTWMSTNLLLLNSVKTDVFGLKHLKNRLVNFRLAASTTVRNHAVIFDKDMEFKQHHNPFSRPLFFTSIISP